MNAFTRYFVLTVFFVIIFSGEVFAAFRTWTDSEGRTFRGELVRIEGDHVKIRRIDSRVFDVPLSRLSESDYSFLGVPYPEVKSAPVVTKPDPEALIDGTMDIDIVPFDNEESHPDIKAPEMLISASFRIVSDWELRFAFAGECEVTTGGLNITIPVSEKQKQKNGITDGMLIQFYLESEHDRKDAGIEVACAVVPVDWETRMRGDDSEDYEIKAFLPFPLYERLDLSECRLGAKIYHGKKLLGRGSSHFLDISYIANPDYLCAFELYQMSRGRDEWFENYPYKNPDIRAIVERGRPDERSFNRLWPYLNAGDVDAVVALSSLGKRWKNNTSSSIDEEDLEPFFKKWGIVAQTDKDAFHSLVAFSRTSYFRSGGPIGLGYAFCSGDDIIHLGMISLFEQCYSMGRYRYSHNSLRYFISAIGKAGLGGERRAVDCLIELYELESFNRMRGYTLSSLKALEKSGNKEAQRFLNTL